MSVIVSRDRSMPYTYTQNIRRDNQLIVITASYSVLTGIDEEKFQTVYIIPVLPIFEEDAFVIYTQGSQILLFTDEDGDNLMF
jgi:hypothetical protein